MLIAILAAGLLQAESAPPRLVPHPEPGWPQWRGPRRDGVSDERGLLQEWPAGGPKLLWSATGLGSGWSAPVIARGALFITGESGDELHVLAFDLEGRLLWRAKNGSSWRGDYPGARASCAWDDGLLYHMNAHGRLACFDAATGRELWAVEVLKRFEGANITWGMSECLLVSGGRVFVSAGGKKGALAALDARTGDTVWTSEPVRHEGGVDGPSYASPLLIESGGGRLLVACTNRHLVGADPGTGKLLWTRPIPTSYGVLSMTPVLGGDGIYYTAPFTTSGGYFRLRGTQVEDAWTNPIDACQGGAVYRDGLFFTSGYQRSKGWGLVDAATGKTLHQERGLPLGSLVWADGRYYCLGENGVMALYRAGRDGMAIVSRFTFVEGRRNDVWAHPVILDGRLYLRHHDRLSCFDVKAR